MQAELFASPGPAGLPPGRCQSLKGGKLCDGQVTVGLVKLWPHGWERCCVILGVLLCDPRSVAGYCPVDASEQSRKTGVWHPSRCARFISAVVILCM